MKKGLLWAMALMMCGGAAAQDISVRFDGATAKVKQKVKDSVTVKVNGAEVTIESQMKARKLTLRLAGESSDGRLELKTAGKAKVTLDGLQLTSLEGAPLCLKNKKKVEVESAKGTVNTLTITACQDTANHKAATIWAKDKLLLSGKGVLNVVATGDGCRGIKSKKDVTIEDVTLNVTTTGDNLGEKPFGFGFGDGGFPGFGEGEMPDFSNFQMPNFGGGFPSFGNDSTMMQGGFPQMPNFGGGFPSFGNDSTDGEGFGGGFAGKHKYVASTKGIASKGKIVINSGNVTVKTSTAGAEGIEGKEGVVLNGGRVDVESTDDAISANATIEFNGAHVTARSSGNDAVDSNPPGGFFMGFGGNNGGKEQEPAIIIRGGSVYAWSQVGSPEEGLDCDFAPLVVEGGKVFSVGGGMGEMPSVPTNKDAKQPTALFIGLDIVKDEPVTVSDAEGKVVDTISVPFSLRRSASLVTSPAFKVGGTFTVKTKGYEKTFTLSENFTTVR